MHHLYSLLRRQATELPYFHLGAINNKKGAKQSRTRIKIVQRENISAEFSSSLEKKKDKHLSPNNENTGMSYPKLQL